VLINLITHLPTWFLVQEEVVEDVHYQGILALQGYKQVAVYGRGSAGHKGVVVQCIVENAFHIMLSTTLGWRLCMQKSFGNY